MKIWIVLTSFVCFLVSWFNRKELDHNQLDVMIQYILGIYKKIGKVLARMIDLLVDIREISNKASIKAKDSCEGINHQKVLSKVTLVESLIFFNTTSDHDRIIALINVIVDSIGPLKPTARTDTDFGQIVRIYKKLGLIHIEMKSTKALDFLLKALDLARTKNLRNQTLQIQKIIEDYTDKNRQST